MNGVQVYRKLLRSAGQAFKGDLAILTAARTEIRTKFEESRNVTCPRTIESRLAEGSEAADFLTHAIVQATINDRGNYDMAIGKNQTGTLVDPILPDMKLPKGSRGSGEA